jgi:predicted RNase H-like HicB family nuclease
MVYRLGVEDIEPDHWVAWVLDLPGCTSSARTQEAAIAMAPTRISQFLTWLRNHGAKPGAIPRDEVEVETAQVFKSYVRDGMYVVNAFFEEDRPPLGQEEVEQGLWLLEATRQDLIDVVDYIAPGKLSKSIPGEIQGSVSGILEHIAWTEWFYFDRLQLAFERGSMPSGTEAMLKASRQQTRELLPTLVGADLVVERSAELWSPRKVLRRILWHERDHTHHIEKLMTYI